MTGPSDSTLAEQAASYERASGLTAPSWTLPASQFSDSALSEKVARDWMGGDWRWCPELGWRHWGGKVWADRNVADVLELVRGYVKALVLDALDRLREAVRLADKATQDAAQALLKAARPYLAAAKVQAIAKLLPGQAPIRCEPADFDAHPDLLNVGNGVVDLRSGALLPHDKALMLSRITEVPYTAGVRHPIWDKALTMVQPEVADYLRRRLGQAATGYRPNDEVVMVLQGGGENGKSALLAGVQRALGQHASYVAEAVLLSQPAGTHTTETMDLLGARLAVHEELPDGRHLDMKRIKSATSPTMKARRMRSDPVEFNTTHALVISTNYRPQVAETDHGSWRRLQLVPFPYRYRKPGEAFESPADREGDPRIIRALEHGSDVLPAVLAWLVSGAVDWYAAACVLPAPPAAVADATEAWRDSTDKLGDFIATCLVVDWDWHIASTELVEAFNSYSGGAKWSEATFADRFATHRLTPTGVVKKRTRGGSGTPSQASRPRSGDTYFTHLPPIYSAWMGVRFTLPEDAAAAAADAGGSNVRPLRP